MTWKRLLSLQEVVIVFTIQGMESTKRISFNWRLSSTSYCHLALMISLTDNIDRRKSLNMFRFSWNHKRIRSLIRTDIESLVKFLLVTLLGINFEPLYIVALLVPFVWARPRSWKLNFGPSYIITHFTFSLLVTHFGEETGFCLLIFVLIILTDFTMALLVNLVIFICHLIFDEAWRGLIHLQEFTVKITITHCIWLVRYRH